MGTLRQYESLSGQVEAQPFGLPALAEKIRRLACQEGSHSLAWIAGENLSWGRGPTSWASST